MKKFKLIAIASIATIAIYSCKTEQGSTTAVKEKAEVAKTTEVQCSKENLTYNENIKPLLATYCVKCHQGDRPKAGVNLSNYASVKVIAKGGGLVCVMKGENCKKMPPMGKVKPEDLNKFECWIKNDAPEK